MKKTLMLIFILLVVSVAACKQAAEQGVPGQKTTESPLSPPAVTEDKAVSSVGSDIGSIEDIEKDLGTGDLSDLDSGLNDIQNI